MKLWRTERVRDRVEGASGERFRRKDQKRCHGSCLHHHQFLVVVFRRRTVVVLVPSVFGIDEIIGDDVSIFTLLDDYAFSSRQRRRRLSSPEARERRRRRNHLSSFKTEWSHSFIIYTLKTCARAGGAGNGVRKRKKERKKR